ncbi:MAG: DUF502 domain-containing protein [Gammaproteobacteria bacterium]|nr:DUF502 domain-containing protein [Gammaproteobacteria bacterium]
MRYLSNILLKGLAAVLPVGVTIYLVYWFSVSLERVLQPVITSLIPERFYWPGMGVVAGLILLFFIGLVVNAWLFRNLFKVGENLIERIPLIKSIYSTLRDFVEYFSITERRKNLKQVVLLTINDMHLIGFITAEEVNDIPQFQESDDIVAVYFPMSYQIGGYTLYLSRAQLEPLDMSIEDAMRRVLTAGLSKSNASIKSNPEKAKSD